MKLRCARMFRMSVVKMLLGTDVRMFSRKYAWRNLPMFAWLFQEMFRMSVVKMLLGTDVRMFS